MKRSNAQVSHIQDPGVPPPLPSKAKCVEGISWKSNGDKVVKDHEKKQMSTIENLMEKPSSNLFNVTFPQCCTWFLPEKIPAGHESVTSALETWKVDIHIHQNRLKTTYETHLAMVKWYHSPHRVDLDEGSQRCLGIRELVPRRKRGEEIEQLSFEKDAKKRTYVTYWSTDHIDSHCDIWSKDHTLHQSFFGFLIIPFHWIPFWGCSRAGRFSSLRWWQCFFKLWGREASYPGYVDTSNMHQLKPFKSHHGKFGWYLT